MLADCSVTVHGGKRDQCSLSLWGFCSGKGVCWSVAVAAASSSDVPAAVVLSPSVQFGGADLPAHCDT